jgi:hypothetical protein
VSTQLPMRAVVMKAADFVRFDWRAIKRSLKRGVSDLVWMAGGAWAMWMGTIGHLRYEEDMALIRRDPVKPIAYINGLRCEPVDYEKHLIDKEWRNHNLPIPRED